MTDKVLVEVKDLCVQYKTDRDTVSAVNGISFRLKKGETLGLVGETGAGKTTTALALMHLLPERTGKIPSGSFQFDGQELLKKTTKEMRALCGSKMSMIYQDPMTALNPVFTVGDQIAEALTLHNDENLTHEQIEKRVDETLEMVGIPAFRKKDYPHQFSGGMKQRVVIAMALVCKPELLIADEPTTALDVTIQAQVLVMMRELRDKLGMAMILITHDLGIVAQICDKVAVMYAGEIIESGTIEDIFVSKDHHPYTVGLFNSLPDMNAMARRLHPIDGLMPDPTDLPKGCKFAPRCPFCTERCNREPALLINVGDEHEIRCHRFGDSQNGKEG